MVISVVGVLTVEWSLFVMSVESSLMVKWSVVFAVESLVMWVSKMMWSIVVLVVEGTHAVMWVVMCAVISCIMWSKIVVEFVSSPVCSIMATVTVVKAVIIAIAFMSIGSKAVVVSPDIDV